MTQLDSALQQVSKGPEAFDIWLLQNPGVLEEDFIKEVDDYVLAALRKGALSQAFTASVLCTTLKMRSGDRKGALRSKLQETEILFMHADTTDAYERAYTVAQSLAILASDEGYTDERFWAMGLAADSAYWCSTTNLEIQHKKRWLREALDTFLQIEPVSTIDDSRGLWERFVSSVVATYQTVLDLWDSDLDEVDGVLRELASLAEHLIPPSFTFEDPKKTVHAMHHLADLSTNFGHPNAAEERLQAVQHKVKVDEWSE